MKTIEEKEEVLTLRAQNYSIRSISSKTGIAKETISNIIRENREVVLSLISIEQDNLIRERKLNKEARLESLGLLLANIEQELSKRTLEDVSTDKLYKMYLDTQKTIREETDTLGELYSLEEAEKDKKDREDEWII